METLDNDINSSDGIVISSNIKTNLKEAAKWGNFLAIVGFVMLGLMLLGSLFAIVAGSAFGGKSAAFMGVIYLIMVALYFFPTYYLFNFSKKIKQGLNSSVQSEVDLAFQNLKSMFKFMGIFMIVILAFYALALIFGLGARAIM